MHTRHRIGAFHLVFQLVIPARDALRRLLRSPRLALLVRSLGALDLRPLCHVTRKWINGGHPI
jgi:hypothetical protein